MSGCVYEYECICKTVGQGMGKGEKHFLKEDSIFKKMQKRKKNKRSHSSDWVGKLIHLWGPPVALVKTPSSILLPTASERTKRPY